MILRLAYRVSGWPYSGCAHAVSRADGPRPLDGAARRVSPPRSTALRAHGGTLSPAGSWSTHEPAQPSSPIRTNRPGRYASHVPLPVRACARARSRSHPTHPRGATRCTAHAACCMMHGVCCMLHAVCCTLHDACCTLHADCCMLHPVCCMRSRPHPMQPAQCTRHIGERR